MVENVLRKWTFFNMYPWTHKALHTPLRNVKKKKPSHHVQIKPCQLATIL